MGAGSGFKTFVTGDVLTAADTNGYLMQGVWVFASAAARDAAVTSPQEGNMCYLKDTDAVQSYSGSAWTAVGGTPGFTKITSGTISAATSVNVNNCFSSTYKNYKILLRQTAGTSTNTTMKLRVGGTDSSVNYYSWQGFTLLGTGAYDYIVSSNAASFSILADSSSSLSLDVFSPNEALKTFMSWQMVNEYSSNKQGYGGAWHNPATSYDGLTLTFTAATTGTYVIYGYGN